MLTAWMALFVALSAAAQSGSRVLPMTLPDDATDGALHIDLQQLESLSVELATGLPEVEIALLDDRDALLVKLGRVRGGKCKWSHKPRGGSLVVGLAAGVRQQLAESIAARSPRPGYKLATFEQATHRVLGSVPVAFSDFADLSVQLQYPIQVAPGQDLGPALSVQLENLGSAAARDIVLEIVLSGDDRVPRRSAPVADSYAEDSLLAGGRETVPLLEPGQKLAVTFRGPLRLPDDLPADKSYLAVVADPGDLIAELSEENNIHSGFILNNVPEPKSFTLEMPDTQLHFEPASYDFLIESAGSPLSDGKDWRRCCMKPSVYQIKQAAWDGFFSGGRHRRPPVIRDPRRGILQARRKRPFPGNQGQGAGRIPHLATHSLHSGTEPDHHALRARGAEIRAAGAWPAHLPPPLLEGMQVEVVPVPGPLHPLAGILLAGGHVPTHGQPHQRRDVRLRGGYGHAAAVDRASRTLRFQVASSKFQVPGSMFQVPREI